MGGGRLQWEMDFRWGYFGFDFQAGADEGACFLSYGVLVMGLRVVNFGFWEGKLLLGA